MMHYTEAESIERIRIQASLAEKLLIALLLLHGIGLATRGGFPFAAGLVAALLAFASAFLAQHFYALACQHLIMGDEAAERRNVLIGNRIYLAGVGLAAFSIGSFASGVLPA